LAYEGFNPTEVTSEVDCHREEVLDLDDVFRHDAGVPEGRPRGGWVCSVSLFYTEEDFVLNEAVETEIAFATYHIGDDDVCELVDIEVATHFKGHGLGRRLVEEVLGDINIKGGSSVYLFAYEPEEGSREEFFSRFGFRPLTIPKDKWASTSLPHPMRLKLEDGTGET
jgi:GNAT superfamily N-acetyltransferase